MKNLWIRIRSALSLSAIGGGFGGVLGAASAIAFSLFTSSPDVGGLVAISALIGAMFGFVAVGGVSVMMTTIGSRRSLEDIGLARAAVWGILAGAAITGALIGAAIALPGGGDVTIAAVLPWLGIAGGLGGLLTTGLVRLAKSAPSGDLIADSELPQMIEGPSDS